MSRKLITMLCRPVALGMVGAVIFVLSYGAGYSNRTQVLVPLPLRLQAIIQANGTSFCLLNDQFLTFDQQVDGFTVINIHPNFVIVESRDHKVFTITMPWVDDEPTIRIVR